MRQRACLHTEACLPLLRVTLKVQFSSHGESGERVALSDSMWRLWVPSAGLYVIEEQRPSCFIASFLHLVPAPH